jgi:hypothetical protein
MAEKIKLRVQFARTAVAGMIQAKTNSPQPNEVEIYLAIPKRVIIILSFVARFLSTRRLVNRGVAADPSCDV